MHPPAIAPAATSSSTTPHAPGTPRSKALTGHGLTISNSRNSSSDPISNGMLGKSKVKTLMGISAANHSPANSSITIAGWSITPQAAPARLDDHTAKAVSPNHPHQCQITGISNKKTNNAVATMLPDVPGATGDSPAPAPVAISVATSVIVALVGSS